MTLTILITGIIANLGAFWLSSITPRRKKKKRIVYTKKEKKCAQRMRRILLNFLSNDK